MSDPNFLITGDYAHRDFREVVDSLVKLSIHLPLERLWGLTDANQATLIAVVICQSRREQFRYAQVESIRDRLPLARIVIVQSDWCVVGKKLPEQIWPGVNFIFVRDWLAFYALHLQHNRNSRSVLFDLPLTANDIDRHLYLIGDIDESLKSTTIGIIAGNFEAYDALAIACQELGAEAHWLNRRVDPPLPAQLDCVLYNHTTAAGIDWSHLQDWKRNTGNAPLVVVMNFPREADRRLAMSCGAADVIAQPFLLEQLQFVIRGAIERARLPIANFQAIAPNSRAKVDGC